jgi:hypothetical protein
LKVRIEIHRTLRSFADGAEQVTVEATTVGEALDALVGVSTFRPVMFAWLKRRHPRVIVFRNHEMIKGRYNARPLREGDVLSLLPMM